MRIVEPESAPFPLTEMVIALPKVVTTFPSLSTAATWSGVVKSAPLATVLLPARNARALASPGVRVICCVATVRSPEE